ncbi:hypothetical protein D0C28_26605 [Rhizobium sp. AU243]|nr:hypothetical protein D0C28_26605 [Rhizobium sp. AU243]
MARSPCRLSDWTYNIAPQEEVIFNFQGNVDQWLQIDRLKLEIAREQIRKAPAGGIGMRPLITEPE